MLTGEPLLEIGGVEEITEMGKKTSFSGGGVSSRNLSNHSRNINPADSYRKQLGKNEVHKGRSFAKVSRQKQKAYELKLRMRNWRPIIVFIVLFLLIMMVLYFLLILEAGTLFYGPLPRDDET